VTPSPPLLLLTGVGMAASVAIRTQPVLAEHFRVITLNPRRPPYTGAWTGVIPALAAEALEVVDAAGADRVRVYGLSFGGLIAQEIALRHPDRVQALVLGATSAGGRLRVPADAATQAFIARRADMPLEERLWASVPYSYAVSTRRRHAPRIGEDVAARLREPVDPEHHRVQRDAVAAHDAVDRLAELAVPTLVVHGEEDRLVPAENGVRLSQAIPGAEHLQITDAAHLYPTDAPDADREVVRFLLEQPASRRRSRPARSGRAAPA
jgi:3-oxoadipate enol-lactonase